MARHTTLIGFYNDGRYLRRVEVETELSGDPLRLSISGTSGRALKSTREFRTDRLGEPFDYMGGQITDEVERVTAFAPGWDRSRRDQLVRIWRAWHLNDMQAACQHQRGIASRMGLEPHEVFATPFTLTHPDRTPSYDAMAGKQITRARVFCPICGYGYGSAWLHEDLPADVIAFVRDMQAVPVNA